jgi:hypothetical protein
LRRLRTTLRASSIALVCVAVLPRASWGQDTSAPAVRLGSIAVVPAVTLSTTRDSNVFSDPVNPQPDLMTTVSPQLDATTRVGMMVVNGHAALPYVRFDRFRNQNGFGSNATIRAALPLSRFSFYVESTYRNAIERMNFEIDVRERQLQKSAATGVAARVTPHLTLNVAAQRQTSGFGDAAAFQGVDLNRELSEQVDSLGLTVVRSVTPLTDLVANVEMRRDRFEHNSLRDADSRRVTIGLRSDALIKGQAAMGYRVFTPRDSSVPAFKGLVATAQIGWPLFGGAQMAVDAGRDISYSYLPLQPYYISTSAGVSISKSLTSRLMAHVRGGVQRNDYQSRTDFETAARYERGTLYSVGLKYVWGRHISIDGSFDSTSRTGIAVPRYDGNRVSTSIGYVF